MFSESSVRHHRSHFHVKYQEHYATYGIDPIEVIAGLLPIRQHRFVVAWAELHRKELMRDWNLLIAGEEPLPIEPLKQ